MATRKRREERVSIAHPVRLKRATAVTRNVSASGMFFETNADYAVGSKISFAIEIDGFREEKMIFKCKGQIVRVERRRHGIVGVAVRIVTSMLESA